jgi:hypothetical protein
MLITRQTGRYDPQPQISEWAIKKTRLLEKLFGGRQMSSIRVCNTECEFSRIQSPASARLLRKTLCKTSIVGGYRQKPPLETPFRKSSPQRKLAIAE